jgi:hypothetical protein
VETGGSHTFREGFLGDYLKRCAGPSQCPSMDRSSAAWGRSWMDRVPLDDLHRRAAEVIAAKCAPISGRQRGYIQVLPLTAPPDSLVCHLCAKTGVM